MASRRRKHFRIRDFAYETLMARLIRKVVAPLARIWFNTCKVSFINEQVFREYASNDTPVVVGTWHRAAIYFLYFFGHFHPMIMISQSKDGEILAQYTSAMGAIPARGSSSRGGKEALKQMRHHLTSGGKACATVLDGPRGPAYVAKKGMIVLAMQTESPFIPAIWSANRTITLRNSWDKMILPLPWSRISMAFGDPIHIPRETTGEELEHYRHLVQERLNTMMAEVDRRCGYR
jgi:lysophospholipid acyltransferase (LPLAT)-like uncharacterized protein